MTAINSGLHFLSGIALYFGALPALSNAKPTRKSSRQPQHTGYRHTPLSDRQKRELLDSIRKDDWTE